MSKKNSDAAKTARPKARPILRAPVPIEPIQGRDYPEHRRSSVPVLTDTFEARVTFDRAARECRRAIRQARKTEFDHQRWAYERRRWSEALRPALVNAVTECKNSGLSDAELKPLLRTSESLEGEWKLVCQYRDDIAAAGTANSGTETASRSFGQRPSRSSETRSPKRTAVRRALDALYPKGIHAPSDLPNNVLCRRVSEWLKKNMPEVPAISDDTIRRAAGRK